MEGQRQVVAGEWDIARIAANAFDLEGKTLGTLGCGRIGQRVLQRFRGFDPAALLYHDYARLAPQREAALGARYVESVGELAERCDVLTINCEKGLWAAAAASGHWQHASPPTAAMMVA